MKRAILLSATISASFALLTAKEITGRVMDNDSIAIEFANITAFAKGSVTGGGMTDESGVFRIETGSNCDSVRISHIGHEVKVIAPAVTDIGTIILNRTAATLKEVVVKAPLITREADRTILNVTANPLSANKDVHELLKTAPGVWATDESLSIYGQEGTTVYVDDRKINLSGTQLITYLKSIQSSAISTIEIIPKGGAEYSADSSGGVIRINMKRNRVDGFNGSSGLNITAGEYKQWYNPFVNIGAHSGKWTVNFNGTPHEKYTSHEESTNTSISQKLSGISFHKKKEIQGNIMFGVFFEPTNHDKLGLQFDFSPDKSRNISDSRTETYESQSGKITFGKYLNESHFNNFNATFNWSHTFDSKGSILKLISAYNYQKSSVNEDNEMHFEYIPNDSVYKTDYSNIYNIFVTEISMNKVLNSKWKLNIGAKYTFNDVSNKSFHNYLDGEAWISDKRNDYEIAYDENIFAIYAIANGKAGRWGFKAGVRGEYAKTSNLTYDNRFNLFPNGNISYNLTEKGDYTAALGYYRNIRRPSFWSLNPAVIQISDFSYTVGNPNLTPSFTNAVSLDFVLAGKFTIASGYSETDKPIRQMFTSNAEYPERMYLTWQNTGKDRNIFIHGDGLFKITKWWNLYSSMTYVLTARKLSENQPNETFGYLQLVTSATFFIPGGYNLTMNCFYNSGMKIGNIDVYPIFNLNPTLQKKMGKHWSFAIAIENLLQRKSKIRTKSPEYDRLRYTKTYMTAKVGVTYSFNTGKKFGKTRIEKNMDNTRLSKE